MTICNEVYVNVTQKQYQKHHTETISKAPYIHMLSKNNIKSTSYIIVTQKQYQKHHTYIKVAQMKPKDGQVNRVKYLSFFSFWINGYPETIETLYFKS